MIKLATIMPQVLSNRDLQRSPAPRASPPFIFLVNTIMFVSTFSRYAKFIQSDLFYVFIKIFAPNAKKVEKLGWVACFRTPPARILSFLKAKWSSLKFKNPLRESAPVRSRFSEVDGGGRKKRERDRSFVRTQRMESSIKLSYQILARTRERWVLSRRRIKGVGIFDISVFRRGNLNRNSRCVLVLKTFKPTFRTKKTHIFKLTFFLNKQRSFRVPCTIQNECESLNFR